MFYSACARKLCRTKKFVQVYLYLFSGEVEVLATIKINVEILMANSAVGNRNTQYTHICIFLKYLKFNKLPQILHYWHSNCSGGS